MRNRFAGPCADCGERVEVGQGHFERRRGRFVVRHVRCVAIARAVRAAAAAEGSEP